MVLSSPVFVYILTPIPDSTFLFHWTTAPCSLWGPLYPEWIPLITFEPRVNPTDHLWTHSDPLGTHRALRTHQGLDNWLTSHGSGYASALQLEKSEKNVNMGLPSRATFLVQRQVMHNLWVTLESSQGAQEEEGKRTSWILRATILGFIYIQTWVTYWAITKHMSKCD